MSKPGDHVNADGDVLLYSIGFVAESTEYVIDGKGFEKEEDARIYCDRYGHLVEDIEPTIVPEPVEYCLSTVKRLLARIKRQCGARTMHVLISGDGNFRESVATIQPYKGNRRDKRKPFHYDNIRKYLIDVHGAEIVEGEEADDQLSIRAVRDGAIIATVDKDLDNTPGWHYNWNKDGLYEIGPVEADRNFYLQLLSGDATDNIPGLFRITGTRASSEMKRPIREMRDPVWMYRYVEELYARAIAKQRDGDYDEATADERDDCHHAANIYLTEIGQLLWMRREEGEIWTPPTRK